MPVYTTRRTADAYGYCVGLLMLDVRQPFVPGDVGNATTYDYPVLYRTVPGAHPDRVFVGDPGLDDAVAETARALVAQGVKGIASDCGFFVNYQDLVRRVVDVPVFLSSLIQLPLISSFLGRDRQIGVITASSRALGNRILELAGIDAGREIVIRGMQDNAAWCEAFIEPGERIDTDAIEGEVVATARLMAEEHPRLGAIVMECSLMPPYSKAVQEAVGLPVYDFINMIDYFQRGSHRRAYHGHY